MNTYEFKARHKTKGHILQNFQDKRHVMDYGLDGSDVFDVFQYTGFKDKNGTKIFYGDTLTTGDKVDTVRVAHWIIDTDHMNNPMQNVEVA